MAAPHPQEKRYDEKGKPVAIVHHAPDYWQALFKYAQGERELHGLERMC